MNLLLITVFSVSFILCSYDLVNRLKNSANNNNWLLTDPCDLLIFIKNRILFFKFHVQACCCIYHSSEKLLWIEPWLILQLFFVMIILSKIIDDAFYLCAISVKMVIKSLKCRSIIYVSNSLFFFNFIYYYTLNWLRWI